MTFKRRFHRLRFFVADAWDEWWHSPGVNLLAVATLGSTLFLAGLMVLVVSNLEQRVLGLREDVRVEVFLRDDASDEIRLEIQRELESRDGVVRVQFVDKQEALRRYRGWAAEMAELVDELDSNPLPASLEVFLAAGPEAEQVGEEITRTFGARQGVEDVRFNRDWLRRLEALLDLARAGGTGLAILVFAAVVFVMASVLRLAVYSRRDEIEIMQLVGATPGFVRGPFLVTGFVQGGIASALALLGLEGLRRAALARAGSGSLVLLDLVAAQPLSPDLSCLLLVVGLAVSTAGAYFAVRRAF